MGRKLKVGRLLGTAASFIPGVGPYVAAADALFGKGGKGPARQAGAGLNAAAPFLRVLEGRIPGSESIFSLLPAAGQALQERAAGIDDFALLNQFTDDAINRLIPRIVDSAISGPLASAVSRGLSTSSSLAGNIVARASQDATERLLTEVMQRRLAIPDQQVARDINVLNALGRLAGILDPTRNLSALLPALVQGGLGAAQIGLQDRTDRAAGLAQQLKGLNPKRDFDTFKKFLTGLSRRRTNNA